jgi:hypothetical protein
MVTEDTRDANVSHSHPQDCPLCHMWAMMPYVKRWSTPTTVIETESALAIGFWLALRYGDIKPCKRHANFIFDLNRKEVPLLLSNIPQSLQPPPPPFTITGPLTNENFVTPPPPLPNVPPPSTPPSIDPVKLALEAAKMPPVEGMKAKHHCPICGESITMGEVHTC